MAWAQVVSVVWPDGPAPLIDWGHFIEATIGLNVAASIYSYLAKINAEWMERYVDRKRSWLKLGCEAIGKKYPSFKDGVMTRTKEDHQKSVDRVKAVAISLSVVVAAIGLFLLYIASAHPTRQISASGQFTWAIVLVVPVPIAVFMGLCHQGWVRVATTVLLFPYYIQFLMRRMATFFTAAAIVVSTWAEKLWPK